MHPQAFLRPWTFRSFNAACGTLQKAARGHSLKRLARRLLRHLQSSSLRRFAAAFAGLAQLFAYLWARIPGLQGIPMMVECWLATRGVTEATGHSRFVKRLVKDVQKCASGASVSLHIEKVFQIGVASVRSCAGKQARLEMQLQTGNSSGLQRV